MNKERVDQLVQQVGTDTSGKWVNIDRMNQFAELIVRECANVAADHDALDIYEEIREHFGVE
jgi:hypothetical protein